LAGEIGRILLYLPDEGPVVVVYPGFRYHLSGVPYPAADEPLVPFTIGPLISATDYWAWWDIWGANPDLRLSWYNYDPP
jgi:hypothetical protein